MRLLALESAVETCSAAVTTGERLVALRSAPAGRGHAERIIPLVQEVMAEAGLAWGDLAALAVSHGPGSFSGIRTGLAAARGLALAAGLPVFAVGTLEALAHGVAAPLEGRLGVVLDARRGQLFCQRFAPDLAPLGPAEALDPEAAAQALADCRHLAGPGVDRLPQVAAQRLEARLNAAAVARAARRRQSRGEAPMAGEAVKPLYLRPADARMSAGQPLIASRG